MVVVAFQSVFRAEIHQNDIFLFFKKLFLRSAHQNDRKHIKKLIFNKKKLIFLKNTVQKVPYIMFG
jgi:hypothetical protein